MTSASRFFRSRHFQRLIVAMLFAALALLAADAACAADDSTESEAQVSARIKSLLVASPYRISEHALAGKIRYEIALPDGAGLSLPETGEQHVEQRDDRLFVTLCKDLCGREPAPDAAELTRYLQPNPWVDSNDQHIADFARSVPSNGPVGARMTLLAKSVTARMSGPVEFRHYWTAREAYDKQGGDCTEFAVLLAAVARARGIPTRVVAGMAYANEFMGGQHVFVPHMWVQSWDGNRWVSYDAALGDFDAGRIALVLGDGTPSSVSALNGMLGRMRIVDAVALVPPVRASAP